MARLRSPFLGLFLRFSGRKGQSAEVILKPRQVRMTKGRSVSNQPVGWARIDFWRRRGIASLPQYPKKTDRLEQRQGGGVKTPAASFCFSSRKAGLPLCFPALIPPPAILYLSCRCEACYLFGANARYRSEDDRDLWHSIVSADGTRRLPSSASSHSTECTGG